MNNSEFPQFLRHRLICKTTLVRLAVLSSVLLGSQAAAQIPSSVSESRASVVIVDAESAALPGFGQIGTGFAVGPNTFITNFHVVDFNVQAELMASKDITEQQKQEILGTVRARGEDINNVSYQITSNNGDRFRVNRVVPLGNLDLAVLQISGGNFTPLRLFSSRLSLGDEVWTVGYPAVGELGDQTELVAQVGKGMVQSYTQAIWQGTLTNLVRHDAAMSQGNSGGPLLNECGAVVGINTLGTDTGGATKGSVAVEELLSALREDIPAFSPTVASTCGGGMSPYLAFAGLTGAALIGSALVIGKERVGSILTARSLTGVSMFGKASPAHGRIVIEGTDKDRKFRVTGSFQPDGTVTIGRLKGNDFVLNFQDVSRHHAIIKKGLSGLTICDLGSSNGTKVDGVKIAPRIENSIRSGVLVEFGHTPVQIFLE